MAFKTAETVLAENKDECGLGLLTAKFRHSNICLIYTVYICIYVWIQPGVDIFGYILVFYEIIAKNQGSSIFKELPTFSCPDQQIKWYLIACYLLSKIYMLL